MAKHDDLSLEELDRSIDKVNTDISSEENNLEQCEKRLTHHHVTLQALELARDCVEKRGKS